MSLRTADEVNRALAEELIWRKKELSALRFLVENSVTHMDRRSASLRGAVALLYAHWEGFVKAAGGVYLEFLSFQRLRYNELAVNFVALAARNKIKPAADSKRIRLHIELVSFFRSGLDERAVMRRDALSTRGNLSSEVLREITETLGLDYGPYETKANLIDERLVKLRNSIAHGDYLPIDIDDFVELYHEVLQMIEVFRNQIDNAVSTRSFRAV